MPSDKPNDLRSVLERVKRSRAATRAEMVRIAKDGRRLQVASTVSPIHSSSGKITALSAIERDISERRQADEKK
jgi:PAS domain S-box-containing protein